MQTASEVTPQLPVLADPAKAADLLGKGYTLQPFFSADELAALRKLHADTLPANTSEYYVTAFSNDIESKRRIFEGIRAIAEPRLAELAPGYRILNASFVTKKAGSTRGRLALHQDYSLVDHEVDLGLNAWIPLCDVDSSNGCMRMVDFSHEFHHISATPPNPSPYDALRPELEAHYLTDVPMPAGTAVLFDTRILHATEENRTPHDRVAVFLNLYPAHITPRLHFWNPKEPAQLEVYEVSTEFMLHLPPNRYLEAEEKATARFLGSIPYQPVSWTKEQLESKLARAPHTAPATESGITVGAQAAARRGVEYLLRSQLSDGEFQTEFCADRKVLADGTVAEQLVFDSSPFVTSLVLHSLAFARALAPGVSEATARGLRFLQSEMDPGGLWRYWTRKNPKRHIIPPDLDDTACISHLLGTNGLPVPDNKGLFYDSRDSRGAFYTWLYKANSLRKWMLWLRTGGKAFSYTNELWQWTSGEDVCSAVNANVLLYLGDRPETKHAVEYLLEVFRNGTEDRSLVFYAHRISLYYFASRAYALGVRSLEPAKQIMIERLRAAIGADGSAGDELLTGLAVCALLNLGEPAASLVSSTQFLCSTQREDGSWKRIAMYGGPPTPDTFGSADLSTGICVEALARVVSATSGAGS